VTDVAPVLHALEADALGDFVGAALRGAGCAVLSAPPGSGKTTTIPLALLDEPWLAGKKIVLLEPRRLRRRCPGAAAIGRARLLDYQLATCYSEWGVADIVPQARAAVWDALYEVEEACLAALDDYEGAPRAYRRETLRVIDDERIEREAVAYVANRTGEFAPSRQYLEIIARGARAHGLPEEYARAIEQVRTHG
jgi:gamma-glutamylcyclotransferase (GGCT)/AIG2-like uncharacterized protein YtfP